MAGLVIEPTTASPAPPRGRRRPWLWLVWTIVIVAAVVAGVILWSQSPRLPDDSSAEAGFARDMFTHHEQAVEMAFLVRDRSSDPLVRSFATDIILTQSNQMGQMMGWLGVWGLPLTGLEPPMTWMGHGGQPMPGMAAPEEMASLAALEGAEAERLFLQLMVRHHLGGIPMARAILDRSNEPVTRRLATSIINSQQVEIDIMTKMLAERGAAPIP